MTLKYAHEQFQLWLMECYFLDYPQHRFLETIIILTKAILKVTQWFTLSTQIK